MIEVADGSYTFRSSDGLWVRSYVDGVTAVAEYLLRRRLRDGVWDILDANGSVISEVSARAGESPGGVQFMVRRVDPSDAYEIGGRALDMCDLVRAGMGRHAAALLAWGWGEDCDDVASWFSGPLQELSWLVPSCVYERTERPARVLGDSGPLAELRLLEIVEARERYLRCRSSGVEFVMEGVNAADAAAELAAFWTPMQN